ncbi:hypothetical protein QJS10_CPB17g00714 [Acorus calamus]|uniref:Uncharacterized protein n=1 Tax=Acorus calamus TaxID=4465 RepID=A0AAV9CVV5_ACOCL|nr:hypothetical protein QJS10_CPB17g00714 [Acorus calamus]
MLVGLQAGPANVEQSGSWAVSYRVMSRWHVEHGTSDQETLTRSHYCGCIGESHKKPQARPSTGTSGKLSERNSASTTATHKGIIANDLYVLLTPPTKKIPPKEGPKDILKKNSVAAKPPIGPNRQSRQKSAKPGPTSGKCNH